MIVVDTNIIAQFWLPSDHSGLCDQVFKQDPEWIAGNRDTSHQLFNLTSTT